MTLENLLILHEGLWIEPYMCAAKKWTFGVGRNYEDNPLSTEEVTFLLRTGPTKEFAMLLLYNDIKRVRTELEDFDFFLMLNEPRQYALIDMCFNLGISRFSRFKKMIAALKEGDYDRAAKEMLDSKWAKQVGQRAITLSEMIRTGVSC